MIKGMLIIIIIACLSCTHIVTMEFARECHKECSKNKSYLDRVDVAFDGELTCVCETALTLRDRIERGEN